MYLQKTDFMNRVLSSERTKWIFVIGLVAIGAGITAKNVISYPQDCLDNITVKINQSSQSI